MTTSVNLQFLRILLAKDTIISHFEEKNAGSTHLDPLSYPCRNWMECADVKLKL
jgi:hypothetical protein